VELKTGLLNVIFELDFLFEICCGSGVSRDFKFLLRSVVFFEKLLLILFDPLKM
jgi:hypothetical protein